MSTEIIFDRSWHEWFGISIIKHEEQIDKDIKICQTELPMEMKHIVNNCNIMHISLGFRKYNHPQYQECQTVLPRKIQHIGIQSNIMHVSF